MGDDSDTNDKTEEIAEEAEGVLGEDTDSADEPLLTLDEENEGDDEDDG
jgi:hypothetical protein